MDDGIEQNPAYGTAQALRRIDKGFLRIRWRFDPSIYPNMVANIGANGAEGHSDTAITCRRYAHVLEDLEDEGGRAMDNLF